MRRGFGLIGLLATAILLVIVGVIAYNIGWSDGVATHVPEGTTVAPPYYYGYGPHAFGWGFGFFGFLWFLFVVFILFSLLRFAFFGRRFWGGGWGYGRGMGRHGYGVPPAIEERMQEWHKKAHGEQPSSSTTPPPPPPTTV
jgi:hypothetical protein